MKQNITYKQWRSLSQEAQYKLQAWWKLRTPPLLSIGQMIEFLRENDFNAILFQKDKVVVADYVYGEIRAISSNIELCDALWEACEEVLE